MKIDFEDLLGIKYKVHGRDKDGFDCYGLVIEVEKRLGREMIDAFFDYNELNSETFFTDNLFNFIHCNKWEETEELGFGDVIMFFDNYGRAIHIGVKLNNDDFIHCDNLGVRVSKLTSYFRKRWKGYRWQK